MPSCGQKYSKQMKGYGMIGEGSWDMTKGKRKDMKEMKGNGGGDEISYENEKWAEMAGGAKKHRKHKILTNNIKNVNNASIKNMSLVAQIESLSSASNDIVRNLLYAYLNELIHRTVIITDHNKSKTILKDHVVMALHSIDRAFRISQYYGDMDDNEKIKRCTKPEVDVKDKKKKQERTHKIAAERHGECIYVSREGFVRLIREIAQNYVWETKISQDASRYIQLLAEQFVIETMTRANIVARQVGRSTVTPSDFIVVFKLRNVPKTVYQ